MGSAETIPLCRKSCSADLLDMTDERISRVPACPAVLMLHSLANPRVPLCGASLAAQVLGQQSCKPPVRAYDAVDQSWDIQASPLGAQARTPRNAPSDDSAEFSMPLQMQCQHASLTIMSWKQACEGSAAPTW